MTARPEHPYRTPHPCPICNGTGTEPSPRRFLSRDTYIEVACRTCQPCPDCDNSGEVWTGRNELDTNAPITVDCPTCVRRTP